VWAVNIPASVRQRSIIRQASQYRAQLPRLTVVGITGSYGKTSAKHFLQQLLEGSGMRVVATKNHRNSELSVAQDMLEQLKTSTDVYVVEMGAYARGEIAALTALVRPRIGVITAIGNQHLALFGSKQNVTAAKWELIQGLPVGGIAVLNTDDPVIRGKSRADTHKSVRYSGTGRADVYASDIVVGPVSLSATLHIAPKEKKVVIPLASRGLLSSLLGALAAAHALGVASTHLFRQVEKVAALERTMQILAGPSGVSVLDDSYSANEAGVINALNHIRLFPQADKRVLLVPLIELGEDGPSVHERVGKTLATIPAKVYIYGTAYKQDFLRGLKQRTKHVGWITTPAELLSEATKDISTDTLFLLEGRIPDVVRKAVIDPRSKV
jgi:UDP-N-acetylmuramoyl-tripeptide--D-alanyl-D-alanine ligase